MIKKSKLYKELCLSIPIQSLTLKYNEHITLYSNIEFKEVDEI